MGFLHPWFLLLSLGVLIPVIVHLFNFHRFKQVLFTNVKFLQSLVIENKKQSKLLERLLLVLRCMIILLLSLLFAQPYIKNSTNVLLSDEENAVTVILDNSFSMQNLSDKGNMMEKAKKKANEILNQYSDNDVFCLLTMDGGFKYFTDKKEFTQKLDEINIASESQPYSQLLNTAHRLLSLRNEKNKCVFFISDFQKSDFDVENFKQDTLIKDVFMPLEVKNIDNLYIDSVWIDKNIFLKNQAVNLKVRIVNLSESNAEKVSVKLYVNERQKSLTTCDIKPNSYEDVPMSFVIDTIGSLNLRLHIDDNPVVYDDDFYFTLNISDKINVLCINQNTDNPYINRLFLNSDEVSLKNITQNEIDFNTFGKYSTIILNGLNNIPSGLADELKRFRDNSSYIVIVPNENIDIASYKTAMQILNVPFYEQQIKTNLKVTQTDIDNKIFSKVFIDVTDNMEMPEVYQYYTIKNFAGTQRQDIMILSNNDAFLTESGENHGKTFVFSVPFSEKASNLVNQSIFVPLMWNIVLYSASLPKIFLYTNDKSFTDLSLFADTILSDVITLKHSLKDYSFIPQMKRQNNRYGFCLSQSVKYSGIYEILNDGKKLGLIAFNYPRSESELVFMDAAAISKTLKQANYRNYNIFNDKKLLTTYFSQSKQGFDFTFFILALILSALISEMFVLNKLKQNN